MPIDVLLVDDNVLFRQGIAEILEQDGRFHVIGHASSGEEAIAAAGRLHPGLILIDLHMPGMSGIEAIRQIRAGDPAVALGVLTMIETESHVRESLQAGANGYVAKDATADDLCAAAAALAAGRTQIVSIPQARTVRDEPAGSLTPRLTARELEVLRSLASADGNQAIAKRLGISDKTLRNHIRSIYGKLGIYDRAQAVLVGVRSGLIPVSSPS